jgi:hypothetical protein
VAQLAKLDARERVLKAVAIRLKAHETKLKSKARRAKRTESTVPKSDPNLHYSIAETSSETVDITSWLRDHANDPALKVTFVCVVLINLNFSSC